MQLVAYKDLDGIWGVDADTDLNYDEETDRWYFRQYQHVKPWDTRDSQTFGTKREAIAAWPGAVVWEDWS